VGEIPDRVAGASVLIVEDEFLIAMDIEMTISAAGYRVVGPAGSVEKALSLAVRDRPDVALLDVRISDGLSYPVARQLREQGTPFAFVTSTVHGDLPEEFRGSPLLPKPTTTNALLETVERLVRQRRNAFGGN
jgi:DNA-binding response OmpR family regulator